MAFLRGWISPRIDEQAKRRSSNWSIFNWYQSGVFLFEASPRSVLSIEEFFSFAVRPRNAHWLKINVTLRSSNAASLTHITCNPNLRAVTWVKMSARLISKPYGPVIDGPEKTPEHWTAIPIRSWARSPRNEGCVWDNQHIKHDGLLMAGSGY